MLNPNFLLAHRNRYSKGTEDRQKTPRGQPNLNFYVKYLRVLVFQTDRQTDGWMDREINLGWALTLAAHGLEELFFELCYCVRFLVVAGNGF